jgi:hypothetical protein
LSLLTDGVAKNSKQSVIKSKNRKYFNPYKKEGNSQPGDKSLLAYRDQISFNNTHGKTSNTQVKREKVNPQQEYMDQMKRKQRYTAFDTNGHSDILMYDRAGSSLTGKLSFS